MKIKLWLFSAFFIISGCATSEIQQTVSGLSSFGQKILTDILVQPAQMNTGFSLNGYTSIKKTPLYGLLSKYPSVDGSAPEWPKISISELIIPPGQLDASHDLTLKPNECVTFNATIWYNSTKSESIKKISLCAAELPRQSNSFVLVWKSFNISGKTTGQIRTNGPTPPYNKLPNNSDLDRWINFQFGQYYIGSLATLVGYDPDFMIDDRRLWVRSTAR